MGTSHPLSVGQNNHTITANPNATGAPYADIPARDADTAFLADITNTNKVVRVDSPLSLWWRTGTGPTDWVDLSGTSFDTLAEILAAGNTTGGTDLVISSGDDLLIEGGAIIDNDLQLRWKDQPATGFLGLKVDTSNNFVADVNEFDLDPVQEGAEPRFNIVRSTELAAGQRIGAWRAKSRNSIDSEEVFAQVEFISEDTTFNAEEAAIQFEVMSGGVESTKFLTLNDGIDDEVRAWKDIRLSPLDPVSTTPHLRFDRDTELSGNPIGSIRAFSRNDAAASVDFAQFTLESESTGAGAEEGSVKLFVRRAGSFDEVFSVNKLATGQAVFNLDTAITGSNTFRVQNTMTVGSNAAPTAGASIDLTSTTEAFMGNRGTTVERDALTPLASMQWYNADVQDLQFYNGTAWQSMGGGDVSGDPGAGLDNIIPRFDIDGFNIQGSCLSLNDSGTMILDESSPILILKKNGVPTGSPFVRLEFDAQIDSTANVTYAEFLPKASQTSSAHGVMELNLAVNNVSTLWQAWNQNGDNRIGFHRHVQLHDSQNVPPILYFLNDTTIATGEIIGQSIYEGDNDTSVLHRYASIQIKAADPTTDSEDGSFELRLIKAGVLDQLYFGANSQNDGDVECYQNFDMRGNKIINLGGTISQVDAALNLTNDQKIGWENNAQDGSFTFGLDANDDFEVDSVRVVIHDTSTGAQLILVRDSGLGPNDVVGTILGEGQNSVATLVEYGRIEIAVEDDTAGAVFGSILLRPQTNSTPETFLSLNELDNDRVKIYKDLDLASNILLNLGYIDGGLDVRDDVFAATLRLQANHTVLDGTGASSLTTQAFNDTSSLVDYCQINFVVEDDTAGSHDGSMLFRPTIAGSAVSFLGLNDDNNGNVDIFKELDMNTNKIVGVVDPTLAQDAATKFYVDESHSDEYIYTKTADDIGLLLSLANITAFTDIGGGEIQVASVGHGLLNGNVVVFSGGTPYDSTDYEITVVDDDNFKFTETFTSDPGSGTWTAKKRQAFKAGKTNNVIVYVYLASFTMDAPILLTPPVGTSPQYRFTSEVVDASTITFNYATTLGAAYQGENLFTMYRRGTRTLMVAALQTANVRVVDVGFTSTSIEFYVDEALTDLGAGVHIRNSQRATFKNSPFFLTKNLGHKFTDVQVVNLSNSIIQPDSGLTTAAVEIVEDARPTTTRIIGLSMDSLTTGKNAFDITSTLDTDSRVSVLDCNVPVDANLFDATGLDKTDPRVIASRNIDHADSTISAELSLAGNTAATVIPAAGALVEINVDVNWTATGVERLTAGTDGSVASTSLEPGNLRLDGNANLEPATATKSLSVRAAVIAPAETSVTFDFTQNEVDELSTPRVNGDTVTFRNTTGTLPSELREDVLYYVVNKIPDAFQLSYTAGGSVVTFTDDGSGSRVYNVAELHGSIPVNTIAAASPRDLVPQATLPIVEGSVALLYVANNTDAVNIAVNSGYQRYA